MTREEAINEINKVFTSAYANYIVTALTEGATVSDIAQVGRAYEAGVKDGLEQEPFKPMVEIDLYYVIKQKYIERDVLDKIRAEIEQSAFDDVNASKFISVMRVNQIIDKYKTESEVKE